MAGTVSLNERAQRLADHLAAQGSLLRVASHQLECGGRVIDCGVKVEGGLQAGLGLARVCVSGLAEISLAPGDLGGMPILTVGVYSDSPVLACMASQYAGWQIAVGKFFAMGSGPMRAAYGKEELFDKILGREHAPVAVGLLETRKLPSEDVLAHLSEKLDLPANKITLLAAPTASLAGTVQIVARALETALHKLFELGFDLSQIVSGSGVAPLPPVAKDDMQAIGRTNDSILYGGRVLVWVRAEDDQLAELGPRVPSSASPDHGEPFGAVFERYERDFYKIDPMLFSPAEIVFHNLKTGRTHAFGQVEPEILLRSFYADS